MRRGVFPVPLWEFPRLPSLQASGRQSGPVQDGCFQGAEEIWMADHSDVALNRAGPGPERRRGACHMVRRDATAQGLIDPVVVETSVRLQANPWPALRQ